jgi:hypothetical protein
MEKTCETCGSTHFRPSRFRLSDVPKLIALRYPVRCFGCSERSHASFAWVLEYKRNRRRKNPRR